MKKHFYILLLLFFLYHNTNAQKKALSLKKMITQSVLLNSKSTTEYFYNDKKQITKSIYTHYNGTISKTFYNYKNNTIVSSLLLNHHWTIKTLFFYNENNTLNKAVRESVNKKGERTIEETNYSYTENIIIASTDNKQEIFEVDKLKKIIDYSKEYDAQYKLMLDNAKNPLETVYPENLNVFFKLYKGNLTNESNKFEYRYSYNANNYPSKREKINIVSKEVSEITYYYYE